MSYRVYWDQRSGGRSRRSIHGSPPRGATDCHRCSNLRKGWSWRLKKLRGSNEEWRLRSGDWRVLLTVENREVWISQIDNRRDAY